MNRRQLLLASALALLAPRAALGQAEKIMSRRIPSTGEELPAIGLGTWQVFDVGGGAAVRAPLREVIANFQKAGGKVIDSSPMYGSAESVAGDLVAELGLRPVDGTLQRRDVDDVARDEQWRGAVPCLEVGGHLVTGFPVDVDKGDT